MAYTKALATIDLEEYNDLLAAKGGISKEKLARAIEAVFKAAAYNGSMISQRGRSSSERDDL